MTTQDLLPLLQTIQQGLPKNDPKQADIAEVIRNIQDMWFDSQDSPSFAPQATLANKLRSLGFDAIANDVVAGHYSDPAHPKNG